MFRALATSCGVAFGLAALWVSLQPAPELPAARPAAAGPSGAELAERHCQRCHLLPQPRDLPRETWPFVLTWMGNYLGYEQLGPAFDSITAKSLIPPAPAASPAEMRRLARYFREGALPAAQMRIEGAAPVPLRGFSPADRPGLELPVGELTTLVHIDEERGHLYVARARDKELLVVDRGGAEVFRARFSSEPIHVEPHDEGFQLTLIGDFDLGRRNGQVLDLRREGEGWRQRALVSGFFRLPQSISADFDGDGRDELVLIGFGDGFGAGSGRVSVLWRTADFDARFAAAPSEIEGPFLEGAYIEQVLLDRAGALWGDVGDVDGDGRLDLVVATAQAHQEIRLYRNIGDRSFEGGMLIAERPSFGLNQVHLRDVDADGRLDLIVVNGNNMELPRPPLRPYHGVRILRGTGALAFEEAFFHPMYGALTAVPVDLDADGDLDLAVNAFYPDWGAPDPQTFVLLENRGGWDFEAHALASEHWGRWLRVAAGDIDGDGLADLLLGAGNIPGGGLHPSRPELYKRYRRRLRAAPSLLVLRATPRDPVAVD